MRTANPVPYSCDTRVTTVAPSRPRRGKVTVYVDPSKTDPAFGNEATKATDSFLDRVLEIQRQ